MFEIIDSLMCQAVGEFGLMAAAANHDGWLQDRCHVQLKAPVKGTVGTCCFPI